MEVLNTKKTLIKDIEPKAEVIKQFHLPDAIWNATTDTFEFIHREQNHEP